MVNSNENRLSVYESLCIIDLCNHGLRNRYPFVLREDPIFTQHELILHYKQNYCTNSSEKSEESEVQGAGEAHPAYAIFVFDDN